MYLLPYLPFYDTTRRTWWRTELRRSSLLPALCLFQNENGL